MFLIICLPVFLIVGGLAFILFIVTGGAASSSDSTDIQKGGLLCQPKGEFQKDLFLTNFNSAGEFTGMGNTFIEVSRNAGIDPVLFSAITFHETGYGRSTLVTEYNNPGGLYNSKTDDFYHFDTLKAGLTATAENLYNLYIAQGLTTISKIGAKYAPIGAPNDPTNINRFWIPNVTSIAKDLGGLTYACSPKSAGNWSFPILGNPVMTDDYGPRIHPIYGKNGFHSGLDLDCEMGDPVLSVKDGVVLNVNSGHWSYGKNVIVLHGNSKGLGMVSSRYAHLSSVSVSIGEKLKTGDVLGACGSTGSSTGTHLHFMIIINGNHTDPYPYLYPEKFEVTS